MGATQQALLAAAAAAAGVGVSGLSLLLSCDGPHGSTTFTDSSPYAHAVTRVASPVISTTQSRFGGASAGILQSGGLLVAHHTSLDLTTGDFTLGCWVRRSGAVNDLYLNKGVGTGLYPWQLWYDNATGLFGFRGFDSGGSLVYDLDGLATVASNTWYWLVGEREGNTFRLRIDGAVQATATHAGALWSSTASVNVGSYDSGTGSAAAYLDDVFIAKGAALGAALGMPAGPLQPA